MVRKILLVLLTALSFSANSSAFDSDDMAWLFSGRAELIQYSSFSGRIREEEPESHKLYLNNIYFNLEGTVTENLDFMIEYQAKTDDLYLLGGFVTIADSLEGIGSDPDEEDEPLNARQFQVFKLARAHLQDVTSSKDDVKFERLNLDYSWGRRSGVRLGSVRVPFGLWDDYSLLRNLSAGKTDPITLGVQLRRADVGVLTYGEVPQSKLKYEVALLYGESTFDTADSDNNRDAVIRLSGKWPKLDLGFNAYIRDANDFNQTYSVGAFYRYQYSRKLTLLGEGVYSRNDEEDLTTYFAYIQGIYDMADYKPGMRFNFFIESYHSDLLEADLDDNVGYVFAGTHIQLSTGLLYSFDRNIEAGFQVISGFDEEGDSTLRAAAKLDVRF